MKTDATEITRLAWGEMEVRIGEGQHTFRDCKVWPGGASDWDWKATGTHHDPGIQPADIAEILEQGVEVLVLSRGQLLRLKMTSETRGMLAEMGLEHHFLETRAAVRLFNRLLQEGRRAGGIFHSTC